MGALTKGVWGQVRFVPPVSLVCRFDVTVFSLKLPGTRKGTKAGRCPWGLGADPETYCLQAAHPPLGKRSRQVREVCELGPVTSYLAVQSPWPLAWALTGKLTFGSSSALGREGWRVSLLPSPVGPCTSHSDTYPGAHGSCESTLLCPCLPWETRLWTSLGLICSPVPGCWSGPQQAVWEHLLSPSKKKLTGQRPSVVRDPGQARSGASVSRSVGCLLRHRGNCRFAHLSNMGLEFYKMQLSDQPGILSLALGVPLDFGNFGGIHFAFAFLFSKLLWPPTTQVNPW